MKPKKAELAKTYRKVFMFHSWVSCGRDKDYFTKYYSSTTEPYPQKEVNRHTVESWENKIKYLADTVITSSHIDEYSETIQKLKADYNACDDMYYSKFIKLEDEAKAEIDAVLASVIGNNFYTEKFGVLYVFIKHKSDTYYGQIRLRFNHFSDGTFEYGIRMASDELTMSKSGNDSEKCLKDCYKAAIELSDNVDAMNKIWDMYTDYRKKEKELEAERDNALAERRQKLIDVVVAEADKFSEEMKSW